MNRPKLATMWLDGCSGCHMSLLDIDEAIMLIAQKATLVYGPLVDAQEFPTGVDVVIIEGSVSTEDDLNKLKTARERSRILVALGDCAVTGNVSAMRNRIPTQQLLEQLYVDGVDANPVVPTDGVPALLENAVPLREVVPVDLHVPGCPPSAATILFVLNELLDGRVPDLRSRVKFG